jgi:hypothetical protein
LEPRHEKEAIMEVLKVTAAPGTRCPMEGRPREYITDTAAVEVPESAYYRRLIADGSLVKAILGNKKEVKTDGK